MKKTKLDKLGRIVIPKPYCKELNIITGSPLIITLEDGAVVVRPDKMTCRLCNVFIPDGSKIPLCDDCINKVCEIAMKNK